jgi:hypothetical protein
MENVNLTIKDKLRTVNYCDIKKYPNNNKKHSPEQIERLKKSVSEFGLLRAIVIDKDNVLVAGEGVYLSMQGVPDETPVECIDVSHLTPKQVQKYRIIDNKIASQDYEFDNLKEEILDIYSDMEEIDMDLISDEMSMDMEEIDDVFDMPEKTEGTATTHRTASENTTQVILKYTNNEIKEFDKHCIDLIDKWGAETKSAVILKCLKIVDSLDFQDGSAQDIDSDPFFNKEQE